MQTLHHTALCTRAEVFLAVGQAAGSIRRSKLIGKQGCSEGAGCNAGDGDQKPSIHYIVDFTTHQDFGLWAFRTLFTFTTDKLSTTPTFSNKPCMGLTHFQWLGVRAMLLRILHFILRTVAGRTSAFKRGNGGLRKAESSCKSQGQQGVL